MATAWQRFGMSTRPQAPTWRWLVLCSVLLIPERLEAVEVEHEHAADVEQTYSREIQPLLASYCYDCHTGEGAEGSIDLAGVAAPEALSHDPSLWLKPRAALEEGLMPPPEAAQPTPEEREAILAWIERFLAKTAERNAGDPGPVVLRRLNNVEYGNTIRELTGVASLDPAREFPPDGAAGEGFMNVGSALAMSPAMASKYYDAAKEIAKHAVFTPTGMRFSAGETTRDYTGEYIRRIRDVYARYAVEDASGLANSARAAHKSRAGVLPLERYLSATLSEREPLLAGEKSIEEIAAANNLNAKYLGALWTALSGPPERTNFLMDDVRSVWKSASAGDAQVVVDRIRAWQKVLWKFNPIGRIGQKTAPKQWQEPVTPIVDRHDVRLPLDANPADQDLTVYLSATNPSGKPVSVAWHRPRLVRSGRSDILLRDAWRLDELYRHERAQIFSKTAAYLEAADELFRAAGEADSDAVAGKLGISPIALAAWRDFLGEMQDGGANLGELIPDRIEMISTFGFIKGWVTPDGASVLANSSDETARTPASFPPRSVIVHPSPKRKVLVAWRSPMETTVRISASVQDSHPGCGNGVVWSLELRRGKTKQILWSGGTRGDALETFSGPSEFRVRRGDGLVLAVGPRDGDHSCDSTDIHFTIESADHRWSVTDEIVANILSENPRSDGLGNREVWHFATEPADDRSLSPIAADSILARWQLAADRDERRQLAMELEAILTRQSSTESDDRNERLRITLRDDEEALLTSLLAHAAPVATKRDAGLESSPDVSPARFGQTPDGEKIDPDSLGCTTGQILAIKLPAAVAAGSQFAAEGMLTGSSADSSVQFRMHREKPEGGTSFPDAPFVARPTSDSRRDLEAMCGEFRDLFPVALCYLQVVPVDEVITMLLYYREDEPLCRLMLNENEQAELDRLWDELLFVSREPEQTLVAFEQLLEYATQIDPGRVKHIAPLRHGLNERIEALHQRQRAVAPLQLTAVIDWAGQAYRRPLTSAEEEELRQLYSKLLEEELEHEEALRLVIARVLTSPNYLYRVEKAATEGDSAPVDDWELANRLSYFLWSSPPDERLKQIAASGALHESKVLLEQTGRMLEDERVRNLAVEFGCQWLGIHNFAKLDEKNERLYPQFARLRGPMYEEAIHFVADLFENNRSVLELLGADYGFLNEDLAKLYGIPGVTGPEWRRVEDVKQYGRGGILGLGAVLAKQSGASRTSPVLRGNWVTSVLLDDALPPPPPDVPPLDDEIPEGLTERQITERHARDPACMSCHVHIDPFGFALENYDAIGRRREVDAAGLAVDSKTTLPDGTEIEGLDGLREYLLQKRRDEFVRQFCSKLLGYALGREVLLSDEPLLNKMADALKANDYKVRTAIEFIVDSEQFRKVRSVDGRLQAAILDH